MEEVKKYDAIVLFERPILIREDIYGFLLKKQEMDEFLWNMLPQSIILHKYIAYLLGCEDWLKNGNGISEDLNYFIKGDKHYDVNKGKIKQYSKNIYDTNPLKVHFIRDCDIKFDENDIEDFLIISKKKYEECLKIIQQIIE